MDLGDQIRIARLAAGLSQPELAEKIGVTKQAITWWETNIHAPRLPMLKKMEEVLKTRFNVTGNKQMNNVAGVKAEYLTLAVEISQLSKANREAIVTLVSALKNGAKEKG